ncbi:MAG: T9SS type A sorting domain-containing protein, partial [Candidatus Cloacimonadota bacterium]|nr:T9SS type A sorting domain-containing protein [Candidatus Cloacimonadota bacterium]
SDIQDGWAGVGNIDSDPLFVAPANGNYHLSADSPCIDAGDPTSPFDPDSTIADMGAYYYDQGAGIDNNEFQIPELLLGNYPNPFNPSTTIFFELTAKDAKNAKIDIFNLKGQKVKSLPVHQFTNSQVHQITWNGTDENGQPVASGIYFYQLKIDGKPVAQNKCLLLK